MVQKYQHYRSGVAGHTPGTLLPGELALNTADKKLWAGDASTGAAIDLLSPILTAAAVSANTALQNALVARMVSVKDFGCLGDGVTDDTTNMRAAWTWAQTNKRALYYPAGTYNLSGHQTWTTGACVHRGEGAGLVILSWTAAAATRGWNVTLDQDIHPFVCEGITFETKGNTGTAILLSAAPQVNATTPPPGGITVDRFSPRFLVRNCIFRGAGNVFTQYWGDWAFDTQATLIGVLDGCFYAGGQGASFPNNAGSTYAALGAFRFGDAGTTGQPTAFVVSNCSIYGCRIAIQALSVQGIRVLGTDIVGVEVGVSHDNTGWTYGGGAQPLCQVIGCHINANLIGVSIVNGNQPIIQGTSFYRCSDGRAGQGIGYGIYMQGGTAGYPGRGSITGNCFVNSHQTEGYTCIQFSANVGAVVIDHNVFEKFFSSSVMNGIAILANVTDVRIGAGNIFISDPSAGAFGFQVSDAGARTIAPGLFATVNKTANQALAAGTAAIVSWDQVGDFKMNAGLWVSGAPTLLTVSTAGLYRVTGSVAFDGTSGGNRLANLLVNGATTRAGTNGSSVGFNTQIVQSFASPPLRLAAGDTVSLQVLSSVASSVLGNSALSWLSIERISDA